MFGIGLPEFILILVIVVLVVGPEELPGVVRKGAALLREARRHLSDIRESVDRQVQPVKEEVRSIRDDVQAEVSRGKDAHAPESKPSDE